jgi:hypothetical protein
VRRKEFAWDEHARMKLFAFWQEFVQSQAELGSGCMKTRYFFTAETAW